MKTSICRTRGFAWILGAGLGLSLMLPLGTAASDSKKLEGPDECGECHKKEVTAWRQTRHYKTFNELSIPYQEGP